MNKLSAVLKERRKELGLTLAQIAELMGVAEATVQRWESGNIKSIRYDKMDKLAEILQVNPATFMGWDTRSVEESEETVKVRFIGDVAAGYGHIAVDEYETLEVPKSWLRGRPASAYFAMRVSGSSMYPEYKDGDEVLCIATNEMGGSGKVGVIIYNSEQATLKRLVYKKGEDWLDLVPINPEWETKRIVGADLELCRVIGKPLRLIRHVEEG